jgi:ABC-type microcin C transport system permease subunit YejE
VAALLQFLDILLKPDNIPIAGMLVLVLFFTWVGFKQALRNDRLIEQGREEEILREMQE